MQRRTFLHTLFALPALAALPARADLPAIRLNLPGPGALPFLPLELIPPLGLDRAAGARLILRYQTSGVLGFQDMVAGNADFAAHGGVILPGMAKKGLVGRAIALLADRPMPFAMLVRQDLAPTIRALADLKGRVIATTAGSHASPTMFQILGEALLARHGVVKGQVRWLQAGQTEAGMAAVLQAQSADAVWCEEPLAGRIERRGLAQALPLSAQDRAVVEDAWRLRAVVGMPGGRDAPTPPEQAQKAARMAQMIRAALVWLRSHPPQEVAAHYPDPAARDEVAAILARAPDLFSPDGRFPRGSILAVGQALAQSGRLDAPERLADFIDPRWIGKAS